MELSHSSSPSRFIEPRFNLEIYKETQHVLCFERLTAVMSTNEPSTLDELMNEDLLDERPPGPGLREELAGLKAMVQAQQIELDRLRVTAAAPTDNKNKRVESEAKDLTQEDPLRRQPLLSLQDQVLERLSPSPRR